jgi:thymidylate synthase
VSPFRHVTRDSYTLRTSSGTAQELALHFAKMVFERTLQDVIKGMRNSKNDQVAFVSKVIQEIKEEIKSRDVGIKAQAIQKLTYVSSLPPCVSYLLHATPPRAAPLT